MVTYIKKLKKLSEKFIRSSVWPPLYLHSQLNTFSENSAITNDMMDKLIDKLDVEMESNKNPFSI